MSDDGQFGLVVIAFVGSVFSPYYARALRSGAALAEDHCAINVALYGKGGHHWAMTERTRRALDRDENAFRLGPSSLSWNGTSLTIHIRERTTPFFSALAGDVVLTPHVVTNQSFALDAAGLHQWRPIAPTARVDVRMTAPGQSWQGHGYFDSNWGERPIAKDFASWDWARAETSKGPLIHYDVQRRDGSELHLALGLGHDGRLEQVPAPQLSRLRKTGWQITRQARCDVDARPVVKATLEDTPFYARSLVESRLHGEHVMLMHESLDLGRLDTRWVETLLPFRMPRRR